MIAVAAIAVRSHAARVAYSIEYGWPCRWLQHEWRCQDDPCEWSNPIRVKMCLAPFRPQFWRKLLGQPWPGSYRCRCSYEAMGPKLLAGEHRHSYRYLGLHAMTWKEADQFWLSLQSLKTLGIPRPNGETRKRP